MYYWLMTIFYRAYLVTQYYNSTFVSTDSWNEEYNFTRNSKEKKKISLIVIFTKHHRISKFSRVGAIAIHILNYYT